MKFRFLLFFIYLRIVWLNRKDSRFQEKLAGQRLVLVLGSLDKSIYRHYILGDDGIVSKSGLPEKFDISLEFSSAAYGYNLLTRKAHDPMAFARGMNKRDIVLRGQMHHIFWLMGVSKHLPLKRKKSSKAQQAKLATASGR